MALGGLLQIIVQQAGHIRRLAQPARQPLTQVPGSFIQTVLFPEDSFQFRFGHGHGVESRGEFPSEAFYVQQGFLQHDQLRLYIQIEAVGNLEQLQHQFTK